MAVQLYQKPFEHRMSTIVQGLTQASLYFTPLQAHQYGFAGAEKQRRRGAEAGSETEPQQQSGGSACAQCREGVGRCQWRLAAYSLEPSSFKQGSRAQSPAGTLSNFGLLPISLCLLLHELRLWVLVIYDAYAVGVTHL